MYNHNKAQQSKNRVHISCDILYNHNIVFSGIVCIKHLLLFSKDSIFLGQVSLNYYQLFEGKFHNTH